MAKGRKKVKLVTLRPFPFFNGEIKNKTPTKVTQMKSKCSNSKNGEMIISPSYSNFNIVTHTQKNESSSHTTSNIVPHTQINKSSQFSHTQINELPSHSNFNIVPHTQMNKFPCSRPNIAPWAKRSYSFDVLGLHEEINDFYEYMLPTPEEAELRLCVVKHITKVVHSLWPQAKLEVFGSYRTGLYLPFSDIDVVVFGEWRCLPLSALSEALQYSGVNKDDIYVISDTKVPIIRMKHTPSRIKVDISFNMSNGVKVAKLTKSLIKSYPVLPKLVFILKQFLASRNKNEVYSGGMRSYCLIMMIVSFLQGCHKPKEQPSTNLGTLLLEFFELYGVNLNYDRTSIYFKDGKGIFKEGRFTLEDPLEKGNDLSAGTSLFCIRPLFEYAFSVLHNTVTNNQLLLKRSDGTILQQIIDVKQKIVEDRMWTKTQFLKLHHYINNLKIYQKKYSWN